MKGKIETQNRIKLKIVVDGESHYVRKNGMTYCGKELPKGALCSNTIEIITCNRCINIFIMKGTANNSI